MELTPQDGVRYKVAVRQLYLQLMDLLLVPPPGGPRPDIRAALGELSEFAFHANDQEIEAKGEQLLNLLEPIVSSGQRILPLRVPLERLAADYGRLRKETGDALSTYGIEHRWLVERLDCGRLVPDDLPLQARVGIGGQTGRISVEEEFLLRDAYFMLVAAEAAWERLTLLETEWKKPAGAPPVSERSERSEPINQTVATYSRLAVVSFFAFVEAFVNSICHTELIRPGREFSPSDHEILSGKRKGRYITLESKLERSPRIISSGGGEPIILSDPLQIQEPFKTFVKELKEIRDASIHFAPIKAAIWRFPADWLNRAQTAADTCVEVARAFWRSCYPGRDLPRYLGRLDHQVHRDRALARYELLYKSSPVLADDSG